MAAAATGFVFFCFRRKPVAITINGTLTLDESLGLQTGGVAVGDEDNDDNDVSLTDLQTNAADLYTRLFDAGGLALDATFATDNGVAKSAADFISVDDAVTSLGFVDGSGGGLPVYGGSDPGVASGLTAVDGGAISLFADSSLGDQLVLGVDEDGDIVFAIYMDPATDLSTARVWMVQFEAISNPDPADADDPVDLSGVLGVAAGSSTEFNFNGLHSGNNLFAMVADEATGADDGLIVIGKNGADITTSQGGGPTTIGVNSQMFDPGEGAYFTFVADPNLNFTAPDLSPTEADAAGNIQYAGGTVEGDSAFIEISQLQSKKAASLTITLYNIDGAPQGSAFVSAAGINAANTDPHVTDVRVYDANGDLATGVTWSIDSAGVATVTGFKAGYTIEFDGSEDFDQVLIQGVTGKFDVGGFGFAEGSPTVDQFFEFTAQATDGDGDTALACWEVGIDGTGIYDDDAVTGIQDGQPSDCVLDTTLTTLSASQLFVV